MEKLLRLEVVLFGSRKDYVQFVVSGNDWPTIKNFVAWVCIDDDIHAVVKYV